MSRKGVTLTAGVIALIGLSGAYFALQGYNENKSEQEAKEAEGEEILSIDSSAIAGLEFTVADTQVSFVQEDDVWKKSDDETFPVDESSVLAPLSQLAPLNAVRKLEDVADISEYGMDEPQNTIVLTDSDGNETEIVIGATNTGTGDDYVMINGDESVIYTVSSELRSAFSDDLYDYAVSEELPYLQASDITEISAEKETGSYKLYLEDAVWKAAETENVKSKVEAEDTAGAENTAAENTGEAAWGNVLEADADSVNDALADLTGLAYADYVEHNCEDASAYGLDDPAAVLTVYWQEEIEGSEETETAGEETETETDVAGEENETYSLTFRIGSIDDSGNYYVQQEGSKEVHTISYSVLSQFLDADAQNWELVQEAAETETEE